ncbi:hypothetical protein BaRGS_00006902 [Batillaria attramentaria]|uniref:C2 domain-containing protein n=1 Tax=Batillaria attramentaria TaxID=370345 RepID=A0ABD0LRN0_9CAEN
MADVLILDIWDKLAIVAAAMLLLFIVLMCVVCIVSPHCWLNQYCPCKDVDDLRKPPPVYGAIEYGSDVELHSVKQPLHHDHGGRAGYWPHLGSIRESSTSGDGMSDAGFSERIELKRSTKPRRQSSTRSSDSSGSGSSTTYPHHNATLSFTLTFDRTENKLYIKVKQLSGFRVTEPDGAVAPYVKVRVYRNPRHFFAFRGKAGREQLLNNLDVEVQTKIQRRVDDPVFNETFPVDVEQKDLANLSLRLLWPPEMEVDYCEHLHPPHEENLGQLHVGLMYLPTSEKLNLFVLSAESLQSVDPQKHPSECYVKVTLMHDGRPMKKTKTAAQTNDVNPCFNETFTFDVPTHQLEKVYFSLAVLHVDKEGKRHLVGRSYIGRSFDADARDQWEEMMHSPRKQVTCWHRLQS